MIYFFCLKIMKYLSAKELKDILGFSSDENKTTTVDLENNVLQLE